jgi:hypothetical protein
MGGGAEPPGTRGPASRCELTEFALPVPFAVPLNTEDFCLTPLAFRIRRSRLPEGQDIDLIEFQDSIDSWWLNQKNCQ